MKANKPIAVVLTDLHISDESSDVCIDIAKQAIALAMSLEVCIIYVLGDVFTERKSQTFKSLIAFSTILDLCSASGIKLVSIAGNHDKLDYRSDRSYLDIFAGHKALDHYPQGGLVFRSDADMLAIWMLPFYDDDIYADRLIDMSNSISSQVGSAWSKDMKHILLTHIGINGVRNNGGVPIKSDISAHSFRVFDEVMIGHYHNASDVSGKIHYIGSCRQAWFDETPNKGFLVIHSNGLHELVPSTYTRYIEVNVELTGDYVKEIDSVIARLNKEYPMDMKRINLVGDSVTIRSVDTNRIKSLGVSVRTTDVSEAEVEENVSEGFRYINFDEEAIAQLYFEFAEEEGIEEEAVEYGASVLTRVMENNKQ